MEQLNDKQDRVTLFKEALLKIEPGINEGQRKMLLGHYNAPNMAISVKRLAEIAGYAGSRSGSLHYGKLARKISEAMGKTPRTLDQISMIAEWNSNQKDERGHGQWILYEDVAQALEELGWVNIKNNIPQQDFPTPLGVDKPKVIISQTTQRERDPLVRDWVVHTANGICECCEQEAPFLSSDGLPYLEIHHVRNLANDGSDTISNAVAVCPNCHRELHYGKHKDELVENLYACIPRLKRE